jgi:hypothetical protein
MLAATAHEKASAIAERIMNNPPIYSDISQFLEQI